MAKDLIFIAKPIAGEGPTGYQVDENTILTNAIELGPHPYEEGRVVIKAVFGEDDQEYDRLAQTWGCLGPQDDLIADPGFQDEFRLLAKVAVALPSPRFDIDTNGNPVTVTGGVEIMTMADAIAQGKAWLYVVNNTIGGV